MRKQTKNTVFVISVIIILLGSLVALSFLTKKQNEASQPGEGFFTYNKTQYSAKGVSVENQPMIGKEDAPVTMILFSDFSCPFCRTFDMTVMPKIKKELIDTGKVKLYFIDYAFINDSSMKAAVAAEAVQKADPAKFYSYFQGIYDMQKSETITTWANETTLVDLAKKLKINIDYSQLKKDISSYKYLNSVYQDRAMGDSIGIQSTPSLFVNKEMVSTSLSDFDALKEKVNALYKESSEKHE